MVGSHGSELPVSEARAGWREAASLGRVIAVGGSGLPRLVRDLMVILRHVNLVVKTGPKEQLTLRGRTAPSVSESQLTRSIELTKH